MTDNIVDTGIAPELFATWLVKVERIGKSSVRLSFANPEDQTHLKVINLKVIVEYAALPDIIRALQNVDLGGGMSSEVPLLRVVN